MLCVVRLGRAAKRIDQFVSLKCLLLLLLLLLLLVVVVVVVLPLVW
jgi:hypothetical protein